MAIKHIDISEFREFGFLQEVNRLFFHPLGLALEIIVEDDGTEHLGGVWDYRDDPEGIIFGEDIIDPEKARNVRQLSEEKAVPREALLGYVIQPLFPRCPRCQVGWGMDGDGNCTFCAGFSDGELPKIQPR